MLIHLASINYFWYVFLVIIYDVKICRIKAFIFRIIDAEKMNERLKEAKAVKKRR